MLLEQQQSLKKIAVAIEGAAIECHVERFVALTKLFICLVIPFF